MSEKKNEKHSKTFFKIAISAIVAVILFLVLMTIERNMLSDYEKKTTLVTSQEILSGTIIDENNVDAYFTEYEVDAKLVPDNAIKAKSDMVGTIVRKDMNAYEIVTGYDFEEENGILSKMEEPVEMSVAVSNLSNAVAGRLRGGDFADISVLNAATGESEYALEDVYILKAMTSDGTEVQREDTETIATIFSIVIDKSNVNELYEKMNAGTVMMTYPDVEVSIETVQ